MALRGRKPKPKNPNALKVPNPSLDEWSPEVREYVIQQLGACRTNGVIYEDLTNPQFWLKHGFEGLDTAKHSLQRFRKLVTRVKRIDIERAHTMWLNDWRGIPFATTKARVMALQEMIGFLRSIKEDRTKFSDADEEVTITEIINNVRRLLRDIRGEMDAEAEREAKAASGTNIYIGRSLSGSEITPELLNDSFIALFAEFGTAVLGLHHWTLEQLHVLKSAVTEAIESKQKTIEAEFEIVEDDKTKD